MPDNNSKINTASKLRTDLGVDAATGSSSEIENCKRELEAVRMATNALLQAPVQFSQLLRKPEYGSHPIHGAEIINLSSTLLTDYKKVCASFDALEKTYQAEVANMVKIESLFRMVELSERFQNIASEIQLTINPTMAQITDLLFIVDTEIQDKKLGDQNVTGN